MVYEKKIYHNLFSALLQCYDLIPGKKMFNVNFNTMFESAIMHCYTAETI